MLQFMLYQDYLSTGSLDKTFLARGNKSDYVLSGLFILKAMLILCLGKNNIFHNVVTILLPGSAALHQPGHG